MSDVLVVYGTKHGSTREVAETIAASLRERGVQVAVEPARDVRAALTGWDLIVVGGALYSGRWHHDAHRFLHRHRSELAGVPVAVFAMGPRSGTQEGWQRSQQQFAKALTRYPWLTPKVEAIFGGVDPAAKKGMARRDCRDWDEIRAWTVVLADLANHEQNSISGD